MHSIVINLKRQPWRRSFALSELARVSLSPTVLDATDAHILYSEEIIQISAPSIRSLLEDSSYHSMNKNALACADSHRRAWAQLIEENVWPALVFEDDVFWLHGAESIRKHLESIARERYDIVLLGYSPRQPFVVGADACAMEGVNSYLLPYSSVGRTSGAYAYLITQEAARHFLKMQENGVEREADDFGKEYSRLPEDLSMGLVFPPIAHSGLFESSIWNPKKITFKLVVQKFLSFMYVSFPRFRTAISRAYLTHLANRYLRRE